MRLRDRRARKISLRLPAKQQQSDDSSRQPGFAQQLTRETREAAGEEEKRRQGPVQAVRLRCDSSRSKLGLEH